MHNPIYIVDLFDPIVEATATELGINVGYLYGHPREINQTLVLMAKSRSVQTTKFPLIALITDFAQEKGKQMGTYAGLNLHFIIAQQTQRNLTSAERMELNFKPTLYPIYSEFVDQVAKSKHFRESTSELIEHTQIDRLFWGKEGVYGNEGLVFTDLLDCIELKNLKLNVKQNNC